MDSVETSLYKNCVRIRDCRLKDSIIKISAARDFSPDVRLLFGYASLLAAVLAVEIKDDEGSIFVTLKSKSKNISVTAICETDGRLRGYWDMLDEIMDNYDYLLVVGKKLYVRGDYQSAVTGNDPKQIIDEYFRNSSQTKFKSFIDVNDEGCTFILSEFMPGHDITLSDEYYEQNNIEKVIEESISCSLSDSLDKKDLMSDNIVNIRFGCTCSKRKIHRLLESQNIEITEKMKVQCKQCGAVYIFE